MFDVVKHVKAIRRDQKYVQGSCLERSVRSRQAKVWQKCKSAHK